MASSTTQSKVTLLWHIENFDLIDYEGRQKLTSPVFTATELENSQWVIELQPQVGDFLIRVRKSKSDTSPPIVLNCSISIYCGTVLSTYSKISFDDDKAVTASLSLTCIEESKALFFNQNVFTVQFDMWDQVVKSPKLYSLKTEVVIEIRKTIWQLQTSRNTTRLAIPGYEESTLCLEYTFDSYYSRQNVMLRANSFIVECKMYETNDYQSITQPVEILLHPVNEFTQLFKKNSYQFRNTTLHNFFCVFRISQGTSVSHAQNEEEKINFAFPSPSVGSLTDGIISLYSEQRLCDFSLVAQDEKVFKVHSPILAARSPVFLAMFESNMSEKNTKTVHISDVESSILQQLLHFVYVDEIIDLKFDTARKLFIASEKYQIVTLKSKCSSFLISQMSIKNVCEILILSDTYQDPEMKKFAFGFIYRKKSQVLVSEKWKEVVEDHFKLASDCILDMSRKMAKV